jgi:hypothetical protein
MHSSDTVLRRVMHRRREGRRPAAVVDHIKADDGPEFEALRSCRSAAHHPGEVHERDPHRGIIRSLSRTRAQMNDAARAKKQTPPGREQT